VPDTDRSIDRGFARAESDQIAAQPVALVDVDELAGNQDVTLADRHVGCGAQWVQAHIGDFHGQLVASASATSRPILISSAVWLAASELLLIFAKMLEFCLNLVGADRKIVDEHAIRPGHASVGDLVSRLDIGLGAACDQHSQRQGDQASKEKLQSAYQLPQVWFRFMVLSHRCRRPPGISPAGVWARKAQIQ